MPFISSAQQRLFLLAGYNEARISRFNEDLNPALLLLADWVITNGNTNLAVDLLVACLHQMGRSDIAEAIEGEREAELERAQVFISYQWDSQEEARSLRDRLERAGYLCWMDIGQMGGGDVLLARVERAVRQSRVVLALLSPRFVLSSSCTRELCLADLLRRPIIPVLLARFPWPPPGPLALVLAQYVYVDLCGVGGHGGSGANADREARYAEILSQVGKFASPELLRAPPPDAGSPKAAGASPRDLAGPENAGELMGADSDSEGGPMAAGERSSAGSPAADRQRAPPDGGSSPNRLPRAASPLPVVNVRRCAVCALL